MHAKITHSFLLVMALGATASAQVFEPPTPTPTSPSSTPSETAPAKENSGQKQNNRNVLGTDLPAIDPSSEVAIWDGKAWNMNDNRVFSARFERYLAEPEATSEADKEYIATIREILDLLSPLNTTRDKMRQAVALLPKAATYPQDANLCDSLLNAIFRVYLSKQNQGDFDAQILAMKEEAERLEWKGDMKAEEGSLRIASRPSGGGNGQSPGAGTNNNSTNSNQRPQGGTGTPAQPNLAGSGTNSLAYDGIQKRLQEIEILKKAYQARNAAAEIKTKTEFQLLLAQFFLQRRFEHSVMATRFYNELFKDGESTLNINKKSDIAKIFGDGLGGSPTVSTIDTLANEAMNDVRRGIESFNYLLERGDQWNAFKRLQEAYAIGEFMPDIRTLPREKKQTVQDFARSMFQLTAALESKDFDKAQELIDHLKSVAKDYDSTKFEAYVKTNTRVSNMHLAQAKLLFSQGKIDEAKEEVQKAMEVWPTNPKIDDAVTPVMEQADMKSRAVQDFDRLINDRNYRAIMREKEKFAAALFDDDSRKKRLNEIVTNLIKIDTAIAQSRELETRAIPGANYAAWEEIQTLVADYPDDAELRIRAEELSRKASRFVSALQLANELAKSGNTGSALSMLMEARSIYPDSRRAKEGINTLLDRILPADQSPFDSSSAAGTDLSPVKASKDPFEN